MVVSAQIFIDVPNNFTESLVTLPFYRAPKFLVFLRLSENYLVPLYLCFVHEACRVFSSQLFTDMKTVLGILFFLLNSRLINNFPSMIPKCMLFDYNNQEEQLYNIFLYLFVLYYIVDTYVFIKMESHHMWFLNYFSTQ